MARAVGASTAASPARTFFEGLGLPSIGSAKDGAKKVRTDPAARLGSFHQFLNLLRVTSGWLACRSGAEINHRATFGWQGFSARFNRASVTEHHLVGLINRMNRVQ